MRALCLVALIGATLSGCASRHRAWTNELDSCVSPCDECGPKPHTSCLFNKKGLLFGGSKSCSCGGCEVSCGDCSPCNSGCGGCSSGMMGGCSSCAQGQIIYDGSAMQGGSSCQSCQQNGMAIPVTPGSDLSVPGQPGTPIPSTPPAATPEGAPAEQAPEPTQARQMYQMQPMQVIHGQPVQMQPVQMQPMQMQSVPAQSVQMQPLQMVPQQTMQPQLQSQRMKPGQTQSVRHQEWLPMTPLAPNQMPPGMQTQTQPAGNAVQPVLWVPGQPQAQAPPKTTAQPQTQVIYQQAPLQTTTTAPLLVPAR